MKKVIKKEGFPYTQELIMLLVLVLLSITFAIAIFASQKVDEVTPKEEDNVPVEVELIEVSLIDSFPVEANIKVTGIQGDACPSSYSLGQEINGNNIELSLSRSRKDDKCIEMETSFSETFPIDIVDLKKGNYTVTLQGKTDELVLRIDNTITLRDEYLALEFYPLDKSDVYTGYISNPKVPDFLKKSVTDITTMVKAGPDTALIYKSIVIDDIGYAIFYLPTGASVLSGQGKYEVFYDLYSELVAVKGLKNEDTKYYLLDQKGGKPKLVTTVTNT